MLCRAFVRIHRPIIALSFAAMVFAIAARAFADPAPTPGPASAPSSQTATPDANEIYAHAIAAMRAAAKATQPPYMVYDLHIASRNLHWYPEVSHGVTDWGAKLMHGDETQDFRIWYRSKDGRGLVQDLKTNAVFRGDMPFAPAVTDVPEHQSASPSPTPSGAPSGGSGVDVSAGKDPVIGAVTVNASADYDVTLVGLEARDGAKTYHLHLHAFRDPMDNPLTDMWVDTTDYRVWAVRGIVTYRAVAAGFGATIDGDWAQIGDAFMLSSMDFSGKGYVMLWHANMATAMSTHVIATPANLPDSYFPAASPTPR